MQSFINLFIALAPAAYLGSIKSPIRYIAPFAKTVEPVIEWFGNGEFLPSGKIMQFLASFLCKPNHIPFVCSNIMYLIAGYDSKNTNVVSCSLISIIIYIFISKYIQNIYLLFPYLHLILLDKHSEVNIMIVTL